MGPHGILILLPLRQLAARAEVLETVWTSAGVNAVPNFPRSAEVKFPSYAGMNDGAMFPFWCGRPRPPFRA